MVICFRVLSSKYLILAGMGYTAVFVCDKIKDIEAGGTCNTHGESEK